jgi:hypothetical protein
MLNMPESLSYNGVTIVLADESAERQNNALQYLLNYGFGKSLQDSVAGVKAKFDAVAAGTAGDDVRDYVLGLQQEYGTESRDEVIAAIMSERAEAIFAGTIGLRGPRATGPDAVRRNIVDEWFKDWAKSMSDKGKALPSLKSRFPELKKASDATKEQKAEVAKAIDAIRAKWATANAARIDAEVARRLETKNEDESEIDLEDLL